jgi:hypothetical protein
MVFQNPRHGNAWYILRVAGARVFHWNGKDIPDELRVLPVGRYILEPLEDVAPELSHEDEDGLREALASLRAGKGRTVEQVRQTITR